MTGGDLRAARKAAHLTQAELAQRIGRGLRTVKYWEGAGDDPIPQVAVPAVEAVLAGRHMSVAPPERLSDQLDQVAERFAADGSVKLAKHLHRLAATHRTMETDDDAEVVPIPVQHDA